MTQMENLRSTELLKVAKLSQDIDLHVLVPECVRLLALLTASQHRQ